MTMAEGQKPDLWNNDDEPITLCATENTCATVIASLYLSLDHVKRGGKHSWDHPRATGITAGTIRLPGMIPLASIPELIDRPGAILFYPGLMDCPGPDGPGFKRDRRDCSGIGNGYNRVCSIFTPAQHLKYMHCICNTHPHANTLDPRHFLLSSQPVGETI
jgi:hypothetical protein